MTAQRHTHTKPACFVMKWMSNNRFAEGIDLLMLNCCSASFSYESNRLGGKEDGVAAGKTWKGDGQGVRFPGETGGWLNIGFCG